MTYPAHVPSRPRLWSTSVRDRLQAHTVRSAMSRDGPGREGTRRVGEGRLLPNRPNDGRASPPQPFLERNRANSYHMPPVQKPRPTPICSNCKLHGMMFQSSEDIFFILFDKFAILHLCLCIVSSKWQDKVSSVVWTKILSTATKFVATRVDFNF